MIKEKKRDNPCIDKFEKNNLQTIWFVLKVENLMLSYPYFYFL